MYLPWVSRTKYAQQRRLLAEARMRIADLERAHAEERGRREELQSALRRSEVERTDLQGSLLRVAYGYQPFVEQSASVPFPPSRAEQVGEDQPSDVNAPVEGIVKPGSTPEEIQRVFTAEAMRRFGNNIRQVRNHVERRLAEYYQFRPRPHVLSKEEAEQAAKVAADVDQAIAEGRAAAEATR